LLGGLGEIKDADPLDAPPRLAREGDEGMRKRFKDVAWDFATRGDGGIETWEQVQVAVLMDIRDEIKALNRILGCRNFLDVPTILRGIRTNTAKPNKAKKVAK
jgi:hypothetical protein